VPSQSGSALKHKYLSLGGGLRGHGGRKRRTVLYCVVCRNGTEGGVPGCLSDASTDRNAASCGVQHTMIGRFRHVARLGWTSLIYKL
jgi:hypothetical protein